MNRLTVPYKEIENRLAICCEFLLDRKKPIEDAYESLMEKLGTKLMEHSEFEYWFKRFQNNQFDLGYDTSLDSEEISKIQNAINLEAKEVKDASTMTIETEASVAIEFNEEDVPEAFQSLIIDRMNSLKFVALNVKDSFSCLEFDYLHVHFEKNTDNWTVTYNWGVPGSTTIEDPEKSIIDHLWFVLKNPKIQLDDLLFKNKKSKVENGDSQKIDSEKLNTLLQSMFNSNSHQFHVERFGCEGFNEDTFLSILKCMKPEKLDTIEFSVSWKEKENYQKIKEIVETDQWKQANKIYSTGVTPLKVEDLFRCERFCLHLESVTPKDVLSVTKHFFNSTDKKCCTLTSKNQNFDINAIIDFLHAKIKRSEVIEIYQMDPEYRRGFKIVKSTKCVFLNRNGDHITIVN